MTLGLTFIFKMRVMGASTYRAVGVEQGEMYKAPRRGSSREREWFAFIKPNVYLLFKVSLQVLEIKHFSVRKGGQCLIRLNIDD